VKRTLRLRRETLSDLTPSDLTAVVGAGAATAEGFTCPAVRCVTRLTITPTCGCLTVNTCG
jgi:hypothetical protein